ncbi:MAG: hypothetical protein IAF08_00985 [Rhizobacter sp.]|nr:hypothetical protein [Chlorobiales bacterium]
METLSKWLFRPLLRILIGLLLLVSIAVVLVVVVANTPFGKNWLKGFATSTFAQALNGRLELTEADYDFPGTLRLSGAKVYVGKDDMPVLAANDLVVKVSVLPTLFGLATQRYYIDQVLMVNPQIKLVQTDSVLNVAQLIRPTTTDTAAAKLPTIIISSIEIANGDAVWRQMPRQILNDSAAIALRKQGKVPVDYQNLHLSEIMLTASVDIAEKNFSGSIRRLHFKIPESNFELRRFSVYFTITDKRTEISQLSLATSRSEALFTGSAGNFNIFAPITAAELSKVNTSVSLNVRNLSMDDVELFMPSLQGVNGDYEIDVEARGLAGNITLARAIVQTQKSRMELSGTVQQAFSPEKTNLDLKLINSSVEMGELDELLPAAGLRNYAGIGAVKFSGTHKGTLENFRSSLSIDSRAGNADADLSVRLSKGRLASYQGNIDLRGIRPAMITGDTALAGILNLTGEVKGSGTPGAKISRAQFSGRVRQSSFAGQDIDEADINIASVDNRISGTVAARSNEQQLLFTGEVDLTGREPRYKGNGEISKVDLSQFLGNKDYKTMLTLRYAAEGQGITPGGINARFVLAFDSSTVGAYSIPKGTEAIFSVNQNPDSSVISIDSDLFDLYASGKFNLDRIIEIARTESDFISEEIYRNNIYRSKADESRYQRLKNRTDRDTERERQKAMRNFPETSMQYRLRLKNLTPLSSLLKTSRFNAVGTMTGELRCTSALSTVADSAAVISDSARTNFVSLRKFTADMKLDSIRYGTALIGRNLSMNFIYADTVLQNGNRPKLRLALSGERLKTGDQQLSNTDFIADYGGQSLYLNARTISNNFRSLLDFESVVTLANNRYTADVRNLTLATQDYLWQIEKGSRVLISKDLVNIEDFRLSNGDQQLAVKGQLDPAGGGRLSLNVKNFDLAEIKKFIFENPDETLTGKINLVANVEGTLANPKINAALYADGFAYNTIDMGNIEFKTDYSDKRMKFTLNANLDSLRYDSLKIARKGFNRIKGSGTVPMDLSLAGDVPKRLLETEDVSVRVESSDMTAAIIEFFLPFFEGTSGQIGLLATVDGRFPKPNINVNASARGVRTTVAPTAAVYELNGDFSITPDEIKWDDVTMKDDDRGTASMDGLLKMKFFAPESIEITAAMNRFKLMDKRESDDDAPFGNLVGTSERLRFYGSLDRPHLDGSLDIQAGGRLIMYKGSGGSSAKFAEANKFISFVAREDTSLDARLRKNLTLNTAIDEFAETPAEKKKTVSAYQQSFVDILEMNIRLQTLGKITFGYIMDRYLVDQLMADVEAKLTLQKEGQTYKVNGTATTVGNSSYYNYYGNRFDILSGGTIDWANADFSGSLLDMFAERKVTRVANPQQPEEDPEEVVLYIHLGQTLDNMQIDMGYRTSKDGKFYKAASAQTSVFATLTAQQADDPYAELNFVRVLIARQWQQKPGANAGGTLSTGTLASAGLSAGTGLVSSYLSKIASGIDGVRDVNIGLAQDRDGALTGVDFSVAYAVPGTEDRLTVIGAGTTASRNSVSSAGNTGSSFLGSTIKLEYRLNNRVNLEAFRSTEQSSGAIGSSNLQELWGIGASYREEFRSWSELGERWGGYFSGIFGGKKAVSDTTAQQQPEAAASTPPKGTNQRP